MNKYNIGDTLYYFSNGDVESIVVEIIEYDHICRQAKYNGQYESKVRLTVNELVNDEIERLSKLIVEQL